MMTTCNITCWEKPNLTLRTHKIVTAADNPKENQKAILKANHGSQWSVGGAHFAKDCIFKGVCHNCEKKGHLTKKCRSAKDKEGMKDVRVNFL